MASETIPIPKPGEGEPIVFFDVTLGGKSFSHYRVFYMPTSEDHIGHVSRTKRNAVHDHVEE